MGKDNSFISKHNLLEFKEISNQYTIDRILLKIALSDSCEWYSKLTPSEKEVLRRNISKYIKRHSKIEFSSDTEFKESYEKDSIDNFINSTLKEKLKKISADFAMQVDLIIKDNVVSAVELLKDNCGKDCEVVDCANGFLKLEMDESVAQEIMIALAEVTEKSNSTLKTFKKAKSTDNLLNFKDGKLKGLKAPAEALILNYYASKDTDENSDSLKNTYVVDSALVLEKIISIADDFSEGSQLKLLYQPEGQDHFNFILIEKNNEKNHILIIDSMASSSYTDPISEIVANSMNQIQKNKTTLYTNTTARQSDVFSCGVFAVKDCKNIAKSNGFLNEILDQCLAGQATSTNGLRHQKFELPSRFMGMTQSRKTISAYTSKNPAIASTPIQKQGSNLDLEQYAFKQRRSLLLGVQTPKNKVLNSGQEIKINNSSTYFRKKYLKYINELFKEKTHNELQAIIDKFDASKNMTEIAKLQQSSANEKRITARLSR